MWVNPKYADAVKRSAPPEQTGRVLAAFPRDDGRNEVRYVLDTFNDKFYISARVWFFNDGWFPSRAGFSIRVKEIPAVIDALQRALETIEAEQGGRRPEPTRRVDPARDSAVPTTRDDDRPRYIERNRRVTPREGLSRPPTPEPDREPFDET